MCGWHWQTAPFLDYLPTRTDNVTQIWSMRCKWNYVGSIFVFLINMGRPGWRAPWPFLLPACNVDMMLEIQQPYCDYEVTSIRMKVGHWNMTHWFTDGHCSNTGLLSLHFWLCEEKKLICLSYIWSVFLILAAESIPSGCSSYKLLVMPTLYKILQ